MVYAVKLFSFKNPLLQRILAASSKITQKYRPKMQINAFILIHRFLGSISIGSHVAWNILFRWILRNHSIYLLSIDTHHHLHMILNRFQVITGFEVYRGRKEILDQIDRLMEQCNIFWSSFILGIVWVHVRYNSDRVMMLIQIPVYE